MPEELDDLRAVVRVGELHDGLRDPALAEDLRAHHDVRHDRVGADVRIEGLVGGALAGPEVLDEVLGLNRLAEVVVVGADAREQRVGADRGGRGLGEVRHGARVLPAPRGLGGHLLEQGLLEVGEVEQLVAGDLAHRALGGLAQAAAEQAGEHAPAHAGEQVGAHAPLEVREHVEAALEDDRERDQRDGAGDARERAGDEHLPRVLAVEEEERRADAAHEQHGEQHQVEAQQRGRDERAADLDEEGGAPVEGERDPERERRDRDPELRQGREQEDELRRHDGGRHQREQPCLRAQEAHAALAEPAQVAREHQRDDEVDDVEARDAARRGRPPDRLVGEGGAVLVVRLAEHLAAGHDDPLVLVDEPVLALVAHDARPVGHPERDRRGGSEPRRERGQIEVAHADRRDEQGEQGAQDEPGDGPRSDTGSQHRRSPRAPLDGPALQGSSSTPSKEAPARQAA